MAIDERGSPPSGEGANLARSAMDEEARNEQHYGEVDVVLLCIESARRRAERAAAELRASGAQDFLIEALEQVQQEMSASAKKLTQGTFFAVPSAQLSF